jgi:hypothetical protein
MFKIAPLIVLSCGPVFIGKMLLGPQNCSLNFFFVNFDFSCIFLKTSNINIDSMRKFKNFKNDVLKVERVQKTFEKLNSFETMLKMLKRCKYIKNIFFWIFFVFCYF